MHDDRDPFREAWRTRDLDSWGQALSPDVVLRSPVLRTPFVGRDVGIELYGVLFEKFGEFEITHEDAGAGTRTRAYFWRGRLGDREIEGADLLRFDEHGKVVEVTVFIRPLVDIATFAAAIGPRLAARRGSARGAFARVMTMPLRGLFAVIDAISTRLALRG